MSIKQTVCCTIDKRTRKTDGTSPIRLRITSNRVSNFIALNLALTESDFRTVEIGIRLNSHLLSIKTTMIDIEDRAREIIERMEVYDFNIFKTLFLQSDKPQTKRNNISLLFKEKIDNFKTTGGYISAGIYKTVLSHILSFSKKDIDIQEIDSKFLLAFNNFLLNKGTSNTTISVYMRSLRAVINKNKELVTSYPFDKYTIPTARNNKRAISEQDIKKILSYRFDNERDNQYLSLAFLSFYAAGMNIKDILLLTDKNINGEYLMWNRAKTGKPIKIYLLPQAKEIISSFSKTSNGFLFPYLKSDEPKYLKDRVQTIVKKVNMRLKRVCEILNINIVTTYSFRHSYATIMMNKGANIAFISQSLGHQSLTTTQNYLGSFTDQQMKDSISLLV